MAASIVAIGLIVLHAFATAVLWFELRSRERRSIERIDRARDAILDAVGVLRRDLVHAGVLPDGGPEGGGAVPGEGQAAPGSESSVRGGSDATGWARAGEPRREIALEVTARLDDDTIAEIDALAEAQGMSRDEMICALVEQGAEVIERRGVPMNENAMPPSGRG